MMSLKIVTLISLFSILFGSVACQASNLELYVYGGSNHWWIAVTVVGGAATTSTIELQQHGSSTWTTMTGDSGWGYWQAGSSGSYTGFKFPLSFRLTSSTGEQLVLSSILSSVSASETIPTQVQYTSGTSTHAPTAAPTSAPTHRATTAPTVAPTSAPTQRATTAPTAAPTSAPTHRATTAPTSAPTSAPTTAPTTAPTHKATVAPTTAPTTAPTQKATKAPTVAPTTAPTSAPTKKATAMPTTPASSTNLCAVTSVVTEPVKFLVPLYIYPGTAWTQVASAAQAGVQVIAIINPDNGPDSTGPDSSYTTYMAQLAAAGVTMVGYIHTSYGARAIADVTADIATYASKYPGLAGIFVDECATAASDLSYYAQVYSAVQSHSGYVNTIINPGTQPDQGYLDVSTNIVIFEDTASAWTGNLFSTWVSCAPSAAEKAGYKYKFSAIAYGASATQMATLIPEFVAAGIGMVYTTSPGNGGATYNSLPSYFSAEASAIAALN